MRRRPRLPRTPVSRTGVSPAEVPLAAVAAAPAPPPRTAACPCGLGPPYASCCGVFHDGRGAAATAERLMRSRYSAFVVRDEGYLLRTWSSATRPPGVAFDAAVRWTGLAVLGTTGGSTFHTEGTVDFRARFRVRGRDAEQRENSRFVRESGLWVYVGAAKVVVG